MIFKTSQYQTALKPGLLALFFFISGILAAQELQIPEQAAQAYLLVDSIRLSGNKITHDKIILREIVINPGDSYDEARLDSLIGRSRENLMNTLLFNFVEISKVLKETDPNTVSLVVRVTERWYIWPTPILKLSDRNFNVWWQTRDWSRLSYGFYIDWRNFRGRKEGLQLKFQWGYERNIMMQYMVPYLNREKTMGMSFGFGLARQKEVAYRTMHNKQDFFLEPDIFAVQDGYGFGQFLLRKNIHNSHLFELRYDQRHFSDSLIDTNPHYTVDSANDVRYFSFTYLFKSDHRDFKSYPLKGHYFDVSLIKRGLWNFSDNTLNTFQLLATCRKYIEMSPRVFFATGLNGQITAGLQPYFILSGIGYGRDMVRSYEYYLVDAQHFLILKNNVKFALIPNTVKKIGFIGSEKFSKVYYALYLNVFFDAGYGFYNQDFGQETNDLQNAALMGYGAGLDFVTYYDVVVRLEFSMNFMNEGGVFLHFMAPI